MAKYCCGVMQNLFGILTVLMAVKLDPRNDEHGFIGVGSPFPVLAIIACYVYFVKVLGPKIMANRQPFDLTKVIYVYNLFQVLFNLYIGTVGIYNSYWNSAFSITCQPIDYTIRTPQMNKLIFITYLYYSSKYVDLLDTIFFVLRKKFNQITFLHVYHHAGMIFATYVFCKYLAGSHGTLLGVVNSFVHVFMYSYYFLTSFKPELKNSLWWKKHITQIQLLQFAILVIHFINPIFFFECGHPKFVAVIGVTQNLFMFLLFSDFYYKAYVKKRN
ncbi:elongation of very long chain fatty acids protein 7-like isoform X1 [Bradysia coprophila]|uniref:elongation of very long chain fatty acids protein 7-like isoform X1 n=1 Tax=Bradysia coprophila TaxID=38358 RepID=UPI00187DB578|nr:elongation of very long chain fatty acids protein 7-like isoform X1 [Bradysia coprophila]